MHLLSSSISILDSGVNDLPRLSKILQTTRHFELLPQLALHNAQQSLLSSLTPELSTLFVRVESHLERLMRREQSLIAKCELQEGRLSSSSSASTMFERLGPGNLDAGAGREKLRLKQVRQRKEMLKYAVERLGLQVKQKERQLRRSVAAQ